MSAAPQHKTEGDTQTPPPISLVEKPRVDTGEAIKQFGEVPELIFKGAIGALALSITFRTSLIGASPTCLWMLDLSWFLLLETCGAYLVLRMILNIFSLSDIITEDITNSSRQAKERHKAEIDSIHNNKSLTPTTRKQAIDASEKEYQGHIENALKELNESRMQNRKYMIHVKRMYYWIFIPFMIAMGLLVIFAIINNHVVS